MTKEQIIEELKRNMPEFKDEGIRAQIKKAIYLYIKLGEMKAFDERYYFGNSETRRKIYNLAQMKKDKIDEIASQKKLVCVGLAYLYKGIAEEFGIEVKVVRPNANDWHELPVIYLEDGTMIKADLQEDLHNIKTKSRLKKFGTQDKSVSSVLGVIEDDELRQLCEEVGYIEPNEKYTDDAIEEIKQNTLGMNAHQILEMVLQDSRIYENSEMDPYELFRYYDETIKQITPKELKQKIYIFNCYREIGEQIDSQTKAKKGNTHYVHILWKRMW